MSNVKKLSQTALLIRRETVLKVERPARGLKRQMYRRLVGGSLPFQNEVLFYEANPEAFPGIETMKGAKLIFISYEVPTGKTTAANVTADFALRLWGKIGALHRHDEFGFIKQTMFRLINGPFQRTLRDLVRSDALTKREKMRILVRLIFLQFKNRRKVDSGRIVHNDLILHNILRFDEEFRPIDFEDALVEPVWIFSDLTDLCFQSQDWTRDWIIETIRRAHATLESPRRESRLQDHFDFGFLRFHIRATLMSRLDSTERALAAQRLRDWINGSS